MNALERPDIEIPLSNGIDSISVCPVPGRAEADLFVRTFHEICDRVPRAAVRVRAAGGTRRIEVLGDPTFVTLSDDTGARGLKVRVADPGDGLTYVFSLVDTATGKHFPRFDPFYSAIEFRFRGDADDRPDCSGAAECKPAPAGAATTEIDYLVKDYASFRRLMLDRLGRLVPRWRDRHVPDLGVTLVEGLAYAADHLSYYQDAVATEAYLDTARRRVSVHRHARLVGYPMHQGCNARAWVCVEVNAAVSIHPEEIYFFTDPTRPGQSVSRPPILDGRQLLGPAESDRVVFAPVVSDASGRQALEMDGLLPPWPLPERAKLDFFPDHNKLHFYPGGKGEICLPRGATTARLRAVASETKLRCGDVLIFEEVKGPRTGVKADADRSRRHAVRLKRVAMARAFVEIEWLEQDALPWPLCLRTRTCPNVSVARGNVVLVDHGLWRAESARDRYGASGRRPAPTPCREGADAGGPPTGAATRSDGQRGAWRHAPLQRTNLTHATRFPDLRTVARIQAGYLAELRECLAERRASAGPLDWLEQLLFLASSGQPLHDDWPSRGLRQLVASLLPPAKRDGQHPILPWMGDGPRGAGLHPLTYGPAGDALTQPPRDAVAALQVRSLDPPRRWVARPDLLGQNGEDLPVVADVDDEGLTHLRFDNVTPGLAPAVGESLIVSYRVGNGQKGNVGAEQISRAIGTKQSFPEISGVRNPLPAAGGTDPEPVETVKLMAPTAFRDDPRRAITADVYAQIAGRDDRVQRAKARLVTTGTGVEAQVALDLTAQTLDRYASHVDRVLREVEADLTRYRRIGHDVRVVQAVMVPVTIALHVALAAEARRVPTEAALRRALGPGLRADGQPGLTHPDRLSFGDGIAESAVVSEAQMVEGVLGARVLLLARTRDMPPDDDDDDDDDLKPADGVLAIGALEIARLDDDPARPENGRLTFRFEGGL